MDQISKTVRADTTPSPSRSTELRKKWGGKIFRMLFTLAVASAMWWLVWSMVGSPGHWSHSLFVPASILLVVGLFVLRDERHWRRPSAELRRMITTIRQGELPMEDLGQIKGGVAPLVPVILELFHELKQQKTIVAELEDEVRQRIANRTLALERQLGSLRQQATRDGLTSLYNRRMFDTYLPRVIERCMAEKLDMSLLMIDVDNFKHLNDTLGHAAGDDLLRNIAQIIRSGIREQDSPFRLGGDEFVVILPGLDASSAADVSRRLIELVDALAKPIRVTVHPRLSIGVAALSQIPSKSPSDLVQLADKNLYDVKATRPRVPRRDMRASA